MLDFPEEEPPEGGVEEAGRRPTLTLDVGLYEDVFAGSDYVE